MKLLIIGLDGVPPELVFDVWRDELPNLRGLAEGGIWGPLESTIPPITVPAWASMMTGKSPGELGIYGFRNRRSYSYEELGITTSRSIKEEAAWDAVSKGGERAIVVGVPPSYPPKPLNGCVISCFLTPDARSPYAYPPSLKGEIERLVGEYPFDVRNFRTDDKGYLEDQLYEMSRKHFEVVRYLLADKEWDFFMFMEIGPDRVHHGFWKYFDPKHVKYRPGSPYGDVAINYYRYLDGEIGKVLSLLDDDTAVMVVSDHGAKRMDGGICFNEWLMREGYLKLLREPDGISRIKPEDIDWRNTTAWGEGGYYGRLFLNVKGREPEGTIAPSDYEGVRDELIRKLEDLGDENGRPIGTKAYRPEELYRECRNIPPDLIVHFGDLYWRSIGSVGWDTIWVHENDTGPDDANHSQHGIFILNSPGMSERGKREGMRITDIKGLALQVMGLPEGG